VQVVSAVEGLASHGFVNYFGLQRFGSGLSATHQWVPLQTGTQVDSSTLQLWHASLVAICVDLHGRSCQAGPLSGPSRVCCRVGALLLNGKWEAAARLILQGPADDRPDIAAARAAFLDKGKLTPCTSSWTHCQVLSCR
jgi:hypothetical protein